MAFVKKILFWASLAAAMYALLAFHYIHFGGANIKVLKKSELTLKYTFFSTQGKTVEKILSVDELREDGIGELLVDIGWVSEKNLEQEYD